MKRVIDNGIVEMEWDADLYFETEDGFYAAINVYEGENGKVPVIFQLSGDAVAAYLLLDDDTNLPASVDDIKQVIVDSYTNDFYIPEALEDNYVEIGENEVAVPENLTNFGLSDADVGDVSDRIMDLNNYFEVEDVEM